MDTRRRSKLHRWEWESLSRELQAIYTSSRSSSEIECSMFTQITIFFPLFTLYRRAALLRCFFATSSFAWHRWTVEFTFVRCREMYVVSERRRRWCYCVVSQLSMANDYDVIRSERTCVKRWLCNFFSLWRDWRHSKRFRLRQIKLCLEKEIFRVNLRRAVNIWNGYSGS